MAALVRSVPLWLITVFGYHQPLPLSDASTKLAAAGPAPIARRSNAFVIGDSMDDFFDLLLKNITRNSCRHRWLAPPVYNFGAFR
ncbi:hypothetical protein [Bradyrhizobium sp. JYMT SZCCT0428]|uniref:hypothetical protein n=1 Tax=Bradyrhizobium sp. JYMT SZCCT0428 TaxID=2807673 RepID=UPI001BA58B25|nr:hypothetical protein [Bradyrhizobium sp. JYMT SZCCT0428]MBR1156097.1 hypothetical protein [Bradyrhizobium sp. JYMT SZCCT0428]